jgi:hypothetical protein
MGDNTKITEKSLFATYNLENSKKSLNDVSQMASVVALQCFKEKELINDHHKVYHSQDNQAAIIIDTTSFSDVSYVEDSSIDGKNSFVAITATDNATKKKMLFVSIHMTSSGHLRVLDSKKLASYFKEILGKDCDEIIIGGDFCEMDKDVYEDPQTQQEIFAAFEKQGFSYLMPESPIKNANKKLTIANQIFVWKKEDDASIFNVFKIMQGALKVVFGKDFEATTKKELPETSLHLPVYYQKKTQSFYRSCFSFLYDKKETESIAPPSSPTFPEKEAKKEKASTIDLFATYSLGNWKNTQKTPPKELSEEQQTALQKSHDIVKKHINKMASIVAIQQFSNKNSPEMEALKKSHVIYTSSNTALAIDENRFTCLTEQSSHFCTTIKALDKETNKKLLFVSVHIPEKEEKPEENLKKLASTWKTLGQDCDQIIVGMDLYSKKNPFSALTKEGFIHLTPTEPTAIIQNKKSKLQKVVADHIFVWEKPKSFARLRKLFGKALMATTKGRYSPTFNAGETISNHVPVYYKKETKPLYQRFLSLFSFTPTKKSEPPKESAQVDLSPLTKGSITELEKIGFYVAKHPKKTTVYLPVGWEERIDGFIDEEKLLRVRFSPPKLIDAQAGNRIQRKKAPPQIIEILSKNEAQYYREKLFLSNLSEDGLKRLISLGCEKNEEGVCLPQRWDKKNQYLINEEQKVVGYFEKDEKNFIALESKKQYLYRPTVEVSIDKKAQKFLEEQGCKIHESEHNPKIFSIRLPAHWEKIEKANETILWDRIKEKPMLTIHGVVGKTYFQNIAFPEPLKDNSHEAKPLILKKNPDEKTIATLKKYGCHFSEHFSYVSLRKDPSTEEKKDVLYFPSSWKKIVEKDACYYIEKGFVKAIERNGKIQALEKEDCYPWKAAISIKGLSKEDKNKLEKWGFTPIINKPELATDLDEKDKNLLIQWGLAPNADSERMRLPPEWKTKATNKIFYIINPENMIVAIINTKDPKKSTFLEEKEQSRYKEEFFISCTEEEKNRLQAFGCKLQSPESGIKTHIQLSAHLRRIETKIIDKKNPSTPITVNTIVDQNNDPIITINPQTSKVITDLNFVEYNKVHEKSYIEFPHRPIKALLKTETDDRINTQNPKEKTPSSSSNKKNRHTPKIRTPLEPKNLKNDIAMVTPEKFPQSIDLSSIKNSDKLKNDLGALGCEITENNKVRIPKTWKLEAPYRFEETSGQVLVLYKEKGTQFHPNIPVMISPNGKDSRSYQLQLPASWKIMRKETSSLVLVDGENKETSSLVLVDGENKELGAITLEKKSFVFAGEFLLLDNCTENAPCFIGKDGQVKAVVAKERMYLLPDILAFMPQDNSFVQKLRGLGFKVAINTNNRGDLSRLKTHDERNYKLYKLTLPEGWKITWDKDLKTILNLVDDQGILRAPIEINAKNLVFNGFFEKK